MVLLYSLCARRSGNGVYTLLAQPTRFPSRYVHIVTLPDVGALSLPLNPERAGR